MTRDPYQRVAGFYDRLFEPLNRGLRSLGLSMFPPRGGMAILDVGCGTGIHLEMYREYGCSLYGIDTSQSMLEVARARLGKSADLRAADATRMPYGAETFDLVFCMLVLHEMDPQIRARVMGEIERVVRRDGCILFIDFHAGRPHSVRGWLTRLVILLSEVAAGRRHFRNYRHFMAIGGLPALIAESRSAIEKEKLVAGGNLALYLLRAH